jgi:hypothetical protein
LELPLVAVRAQQLGSGQLDAAFDMVVGAIESEMAGPEQSAARLFFNLDHASSLLGKERRNMEIAAVTNASSNAWRRSETHLALMRDLARAVLRRQPKLGAVGEPLAPKLLIPEEQKPSVRRVSAVELDTFLKAMGTGIGRYKHAFLAGLLAPWSDGESAQEEPRELSLVGVAGFSYLKVHAEHHDAIELRMPKNPANEYDSAIIRMVLSDTTPVWTQRFTFPSIDGVASFIAQSNFGSFNKWRAQGVNATPQSVDNASLS